MRFIRAMFTSAGMLMASAATAMAAPINLIQDPQSPVKVDVHTTESHTVWYTDPVWLVVGGAVVLLIIVLAIMAARGRDTSSTTVVR